VRIGGKTGVFDQPALGKKHFSSTRHIFALFHHFPAMTVAGIN
jgi:hypothetical protein